MSSPFSRKTKRGTEETLEALSQTITWASRIDTKNDATEIDLDFVDELHEEEERLREVYRIKTTEVEIDNFVFNHIELVTDILCGNLDDQVDALNSCEEYIAEEFGSEKPLSLTKEELSWLVAREVEYHQNSTNGLEEYSESPIADVDLQNMGEKPSQWDSYPKYHRS